MATRQITGASIQARTRPPGMTLALMLAVITVSLTLSLIASRSTITRAQREAARLRTELTASRSAASAFELHPLAAREIKEGRFERVRGHVVAKTGELATPTRSGT
jgi:hypothetical protein